MMVNEDALATSAEIKELKAMVQELQSTLDNAVGVEGVIVRFYASLESRFTETARTEAAQTRKLAREASDLIADMHKWNRELTKRIEADAGLRRVIGEFLAVMSMDRMAAHPTN